ncbi:MAG: biotin/lipoyl-containing protein, partial [Mariprofundaceae bacterium]
MADIEIKVPSLGESESEATLVSWLVGEGDAVAVDDVLAEIESDKITMEITALDNGVLKKVFKQAGETVEPGEVVALVDDSAAAKAEKKTPEKKAQARQAAPEKAKAEKTPATPRAVKSKAPPAKASAQKKAAKAATRPAAPASPAAAVSVSAERKEER